jgi:hypothetical protein
MAKEYRGEHKDSLSLDHIHELPDWQNPKEKSKNKRF